MKSTASIAVKLATTLAMASGTASAGIDYFMLQLPSGTGGIISVSPVSDFYWKNSKIQVQAIPDAGYRFLGWTSGVASSKNPDSLLMDAHKTVAAKFVDTAELVPHGGFEFGYTKWIRATDAGNPTQYTIRNGAACIDPSIASPKSYHIQFLYDLPPMTKGQKFSLTFKGHSTASHRVLSMIRNKNSPWNTLSNSVWKTTQSSPQTFQMELTATDSASAPRLALDLGLDSSEICLDDISLRRVAAPIVQLGNFAFRTAGLLARDGSIRVRTEGAGTWTLKSLDGRTVSQGRVSSAGILEIADAPSGIGFLSIQTDKGSETYRFANF